MHSCWSKAKWGQVRFAKQRNSFSHSHAKAGVGLLMGCKCQSNAEVKEEILLSHTENGSGKLMDSLGVVPDIGAIHVSAIWEA
jgi:hypothetical protein